MPRPRLDQVRTAQIVAAAAEVLSERGYANTRVVDIANRAGTSPAAILYWFAGKDELLAQALGLAEQHFHEQFTIQADAAPTASQRLRILIAAMLHHYDWKLWMELTVRALREPSAAAERDRLDRRWRAALRAAIVEGQRNGEFNAGDADDIMMVLAGLLDGLAPLVTLRAKGVDSARVERVWLAQAAAVLGPGFDSSPLPRGPVR